MHSPEGTIFYKYDAEGNLIEKQQPDNGTWLYIWNAAGMLDHVVRPDQQVVRFAYDALGRRVSKEFQGRITRWVWDGNNPLHEWVEAAPVVEGGRQDAVPTQDEPIPQQQEFYIGHPPTGPPAADDAPLQQDANATDDGLITWLFEPESFAPVAKVQGDKVYSIVTDYLGTPVAMVDQDGNKVWSADIGVFGKLRNVEGQQMDCPFRWPGQYEDAETGLYYNWFRYFDPEIGEYVSQDPIGLVGGTRLYGYVDDVVTKIDPWGLKATIDDKGFFAKSHEYGQGKSPSGRVRIPYQGTRGRDFTAANKAAGFDSTPDGYTWHHANYNSRTGYGDMQLVRHDVHAARSHSGGVSRFKASTGLKYDSITAVKHVESKGRLRGRSSCK
ncbi:MAG: RHS repeat-associated core domain-containing protein [Candidatus Electrothrix sp. GW3-4]|uniref:RHS repeat-associated core domain-containing protein n=1 Tax=Candidatus Electrothrix sp. GW3-4 TaxID=3126740 RepID=UPI0030D2EB70